MLTTAFNSMEDKIRHHLLRAAGTIDNGTRHKIVDAVIKCQEVRIQWGGATSSIEDEDSSSFKDG